MLQIKTGLYGEKNLGICNSIIGQLSDGMWENSRTMEKYWQNCDFELDEKTGEVILIIKNEYIFHSRGGYGRPIYLKNEGEILQWFADKLKKVCKTEEEDNDYWKANIHWKRNCMEESKYIHSYKSGVKNPTIAECYKAYDVLMGRNTDKYVYGE